LSAAGAAWRPEAEDNERTGTLRSAWNYLNYVFIGYKPISQPPSLQTMASKRQPAGLNEERKKKT